MKNLGNSIRLLAMILVLGMIVKPGIPSQAGYQLDNTKLDVCEDFQFNTLDQKWQWIDPLGDSNYSLTENRGYLRLMVPSGGHDFYSNRNAPRMMQTLSGDFTVETRILFSPQYNYQGAGLFLWFDDRNFIRLERTLVQGVDVWYSIDGYYQGIEIPYSLNSIYLRMVRSDGWVTLSYSSDGLQWENVTNIPFPSANPLQLGLILVNQAENHSIFADFDYFRLNDCEFNNGLQVFLPLVFGRPPIHNIGVLVLAYYPPSSTDPNLLDPVETGLENRTITEMREYVKQMSSDLVKLAGAGTQYHGYKNPSAAQYLGFTVYDTEEYLIPIPKGYPLNPPHYLWGFRNILDRVNICDHIDHHNVREVWIYGYESTVMHPSESKMSSRYGDISNSYRDDYLPEEFRMPRCNQAYTVYGFNYGREIDTELENRMHQIETVMGYIDDSLFTHDFGDPYGGYNSIPQHNFLSSCGNAHLTPNWFDVESNKYIYNLTNFAENNCETWNPDDTKTTYVMGNCEQWGCTKLGFFTWFMQNIPGYQNDIVFQDKQMRNWWDAIYDFNAYMDEGRTFYKP